MELTENVTHSVVRVYPDPPPTHTLLMSYFALFIWCYFTEDVAPLFFSMTLHFPSIPLSSVIIFFIPMASLFSAHGPDSLYLKRTHCLHCTDLPSCPVSFLSSPFCLQYSTQSQTLLPTLPSLLQPGPWPHHYRDIALDKELDSQTRGPSTLSTSFPFLKVPRDSLTLRSPSSSSHKVN